ncbi:C-type lectin domain family 4 member M-like isoform X2 [Hypanus sabinus]|uniref:C-type lectin domain family 4 member M-like isoform X2 n=1 Tax=Hypanus sabinus TaxID=79690 RepID=UPI0028C489C6|nr:C-type lectin domain family 4 member M-like isoform X2 [Hypanus sabinus]
MATAPTMARGGKGQPPAGSQIRRPSSLSNMEGYEGMMVGMDVSSGPQGLASALSEGQLPTAMLEMQSEFMDELGFQQDPVLRKAPSDGPQEPAWLKPLGSNWNKVALALLGLCVALAVIALVLYIEGSRLYREETGQLALSNALQQKSSQLWDSLRLHPGGSLCSDYQQMFTHWLTAFCRLANCTSQLCHRLWSYFDGSCYYFSRTAEDWASGRQECIAQGAELLVIRSKREQFVAGFDSRNAYWIGMREVPQNLSWVWVDGTPLQDDLTFWERGYPTGYFDYQLEVFGHCGMLRRRAWVNAACGARHRWICKRTSEKLPFNL